MIDEKKLIEDFLNNYLVYNDGTWNDAMDRAIELAKTAPKVGEWIPVQERLPKDGETYLITNAESFEQYHIYMGWYDGIKGMWHMEGNFERKMNVIAWMELPEPYKGESK